MATFRCSGLSPEGPGADPLRKDFADLKTLDDLEWIFPMKCRQWKEYTNRRTNRH